MIPDEILLGLREVMASEFSVLIGKGEHVIKVLVGADDMALFTKYMGSSYNGDLWGANVIVEGHRGVTLIGNNGTLHTVID